MIGVTVVTGESLEDQGAVDISEIQAEVPNLSIYAGRNQSTTLTAFMRGIGQADPLWGVDPGVGQPAKQPHWRTHRLLGSGRLARAFAP